MLVTKRFSALNGTALLLGVLAGFAAVAFRYLVRLIENIAFKGEFAATAREHNEFIVSPWAYLVMLVPAVGGLVVGLIRTLFPEIRGLGIAEVMGAVQAKGGDLKARTSWGHALISATTVGTGGSTGREGPIAYIGSAIGSSLGRHLGLRPRDVKVLVGAGCAAGIGATFNAPLGGVLFAMELILPEFSTHAFIPVVVATVIAVTVAHLFFGDSPTFLIPEFSLVSPWELGLYLVLGLLCGLGGVAFIRVFEKARDIGDNLRIPILVKPVLGGLMVGIMGFLIYLATQHPFLGGQGHYHIFGTGYATVSGIMRGEDFLLVVPLLVLLILVKPIATSITVGGGGGGGVFGASLFQGAMYGGLIGLVANSVLPGQVASPGAYALVGMGAFYASTGRATLTTIVLMSELTNGYAIVVPLMFAAVSADAVSVGLSKDSIYTSRLRKRGILYEHDRVQSPLDFAQVKDVMTTQIDSLPDHITVGEAFNQMVDLGHNGFPVLDQDGQLVGLITRSDTAKALHDGKADQRLGDLVSGLLITVFPEELLHKARDRLYEQDIGRLLVVDPMNRKRLLGILTRTDILQAEAKLDVEHTDAWSDPRQG